MQQTNSRIWLYYDPSLIFIVIIINITVLLNPECDAGHNFEQSDSIPAGEDGEQVEDGWQRLLQSIEQNA